jgi:Ribosomal protein L4
MCTVVTRSCTRRRAPVVRVPVIRCRQFDEVVVSLSDLTLVILDRPARKIYDQAWRIALSHRLSRGELIVVDNSIGIDEAASPFFIRNLVKAHGWYQKGRSTFVTLKPNEMFSDAVEKFGNHARTISVEDLDVKNVLETARLVIEKNALHKILLSHSTDLAKVDTLFSPSANGEKVYPLDFSRMKATWKNV